MNDLLIEQDVKMMDDEIIKGLGLKMYVGLIEGLGEEKLKSKFLSKYTQSELMLMGAKILERLANYLYEEE